jgi:hypothetical protein
MNRGAERRAASRGNRGDEPHRGDLVSRILGAYMEMPGLQLRPEQGARLFGIRSATARIVLNDLVNDGRLSLTADGQYRLP